MSVTESIKFPSHPLNVAEDKIEQTLNRIRGETSNGPFRKTFHSSNSASQVEEKVSQSDEFPVLQNDIGSIESSNCHVVDKVSSKSLTTDPATALSSDKNEESMSHESKWLREHLGRPLILGLREIIVKQPRDPLDYLAHSLLNYRSSQVMSKHRRQELTLRRSQLQRLESEKILAKQAKDECEYQMENDDESGGLDDGNFKNYNMTQIA